MYVQCYCLMSWLFAFFYLLILSTHYARLDLYLVLVLKYVVVLEIVNLDGYNDSKNSSRYLATADAFTMILCNETGC